MSYKSLHGREVYERIGIGSTWVLTETDLRVSAGHPIEDITIFLTSIYIYDKLPKRSM
jgi:hypothetical protein